MGSFGGLYIGISGVFAAHKALDVTGHNISNVNTAGYSRQVVNYSASKPHTYSANGGSSARQLGTGVDLQEIKQYRDEYLDRKYRRENQQLGYWETKYSGIEELETILNDDTEDGLQAVMDDFWNAWTQLAKPTGGLTARSLVKESAIAFVETVKNVDHLLNNFRENKDNEIVEGVDRINQIVKNISGLNYRIKKEESSGARANDLRDERSNLIDELSGMANINVQEDDTLSIYLEGYAIVDDTSYDQIATVTDFQNSGYVKLALASTNEDIEMSGGSIKAMIETRDNEVEGFRERLNQLVIGVANEVNAIHKQGYGTGKDDAGNRNMFINGDDGSAAGINIKNIQYNPELNQISNIAAAKEANNAEDLRIAEQLAELRNKDIFSDTKYNDSTGNKNNFDDFYRKIITDIGLIGLEAKNGADSQATLVSKTENDRQALSGVSMDEEMSNMIKYQHSYNAASRIVNVMDEMLDIVVNKIGLVGR